MNPIKSLLQRSSLTFAIAATSIVPMSLSVHAEELRSFGPVYTEIEVNTIQPSSPNPYKATLPEGVTPDYDYWNSFGHWQLQNAVASGATRNHEYPWSEDTITENPESDPTIQNLTELLDFGTGDTVDRVFIEGSFSGVDFVQTVVREENGSIATAVETTVKDGQITSLSSLIGDGVFGNSGQASGDFDFYKTGHLLKNVLLRVSVSTLPTENFNAFITLWSASGDLLAGNGQEINFIVETEGTYYICIGSANGTRPYPIDPHVAGSGQGVGSEGHYSATISVSDIDTFEFELEAGDVIGFSNGSNSPINAMVFDKKSSPETLLATQQNASWNYIPGLVDEPSLFPLVHPMIAERSSVQGAYVVQEQGTYRISLVGLEFRDYTADIRVLRPNLAGVQQRIDVCFGGDIIDEIQVPVSLQPSIWDGKPGTIAVTPMHSFMDSFGLDPVMTGSEPGFYSDYDRLTDGIMDKLRDLLPHVDFRLSFDNIPSENYSQLFIMGTVSEVGINTIGIAETIDPGNMDTSDDAVILLDGLALGLFEWPIHIPEFNEGNDEYAKAKLIELLARTIGNIAAHEAGHYLGNFHTDSGGVLSIMDRGRFLSDIMPVGPDGEYNTSDDRTVPFTTDLYSRAEGFGGIEDTSAVNMWGTLAASPSVDLNILFVNYNRGLNGTGTENDPFNKTIDAVNVINDGGTINFEAGNGSETFSAGDKISRPMTLKKHGGEGVVRIGE